MMKKEFKKIKFAYGLMMDIKGYHIQISSSSNSPTEKSNDCYTISPSLLPVDYQFSHPESAKKDFVLFFGVGTTVPKKR
jgi:hypothetical protein